MRFFDFKREASLSEASLFIWAKINQ